MKKTIHFLAAYAMFTCVLSGCLSAQEPMTTNDLFNIPTDATAVQLEERLLAIMTHRPEGITTQVQAMAFVEKRNAAVQTIAELMLKREEASQKQKDSAREIKLQAIALDGRHDLDKAISNVEAYQKELTEIKSEVMYQAQMVVFQLKITKIARAAMMGEEGEHVKNFKKFLEDAKTFLNENEFQAAYAMLPMMLLQVAEMLDEDGKEELQKFVITELKPIFEKIDSEEAKEVLARMEGLLRFAELPGSEIEFECMLLDGKKQNIKDYRSKVVLIDFWATWCMPCRMAIPMMKTLYDKYHDKGFELIAYSCDEDLDDLKEFEENSPHPWHVASVVMSIEAELTDYSAYYGIPGYPTFVLVGKDGKVLHVTHDITEIVEKLAEIF